MVRDTRVRVRSSYASGLRYCGNDEGSYLRIMDSCFTQLKAQEPSRTCTERKEEEEEVNGSCLGVCLESTLHQHVVHKLGWLI